MARKADPDLDRRREKSGARLDEVIKMRGYQSKQFLLMMKEKYGDKDETSENGYYLSGFNSESALSKVINGHSTLQNKHARMAADILDIDVNYLLGTVDDFKSETYEEYLIAYVKQESYRQSWNKYRDILEMAGAKISQVVYDSDDKPITYIIFKNGRHAQFSAGDMEKYINRFYEDICEFASKRFESVMDLGV